LRISGAAYRLLRDIAAVVAQQRVGRRENGVASSNPERYMEVVYGAVFPYKSYIGLIVLQELSSS